MLEDADDGRGLTEFELERERNIARTQGALAQLQNVVEQIRADPASRKRPRTRATTGPARAVAAAAQAAAAAQVPPLPGEVEARREVENFFAEFRARFEADRQEFDREREHERRRERRANDPEYRQRVNERRRVQR